MQINVINHMKKIICLVACSALILMGVGCQNNKQAFDAKTKCASYRKEIEDRYFQGVSVEIFYSKKANSCLYVAEISREGGTHFIFADHLNSKRISEVFDMFNETSQKEKEKFFDLVESYK